MSRLPPPPSPPREPARAPFPVIAVIAPIVGALAIGAIIRSPYVLVFAVLSPLIAIATMLDGRRQARTHRRSEAARFERECQAFEAAIAQAHRVEAVAARSASQASTPDANGARLVRIGSAPGRSAVVGDLSVPLGEGEAERRVAALLARAAVNPELPALVPRGSITVLGTGLAAEALERRLRSEAGVEVSRVPAGSALPDTQDGTLLHVRTATRIDARVGDRLLKLRSEYDSAALRFKQRERSKVETELPESVSWQSIAHEGQEFAVPVGRDGDGVVTIDLVEAGPHAIIGGTTGSGKSELLRCLALGWAAAAPPSQAQVLFVDFKGGATFSGLTELPHCAGLVTDLDSIGAARVLHSLRAEVRRRERLLATRGARDIRESPDVAPRLLVLVDEYAAMLEVHPELAPLFADLVARGRSLGMHLVLCTQVPGTSVREAIAANCPVRVSFRITEPMAASFVGRSAPELVGAQPGRALAIGARHNNGNGVAGAADAKARLLQVACITDSDIARVSASWQHSARSEPPWLPPLPLSIDRETVHKVASTASTAVDSRAAAQWAGAIAFGLTDLPDEQRRAVAWWNPRRDGTLGVVGAAQSGRSTALAAVAASATASGFRPVILPTQLSEAWATLEELRDVDSRLLVLADDLDLLFTRSRDAAADLLERWDDAVVAVQEAGGAVAASLSPSSAARGQLSSRFSSRLLLRTSDADEFAMLGGPRGGYDRSAPAGRGWWAGQLVQVLHEKVRLGPPQSPAPISWTPSSSADTVIVCRRPARVASMLAAEHPDLMICTDLHALVSTVASGDVALRPRVLLGSPGEWSAVWSQLQSLQARSTITVIDVSASEARALLGLRGPLPPLDVARGDLWAVTPGEPPQRQRWAALQSPDASTAT